MAIKKGIYAASMSIFNQDLSLDIDSTIEHSENLIEQGLHGCVLFGIFLFWNEIVVLCFFFKVDACIESLLV